MYVEKRDVEKKKCKRTSMGIVLKEEIMLNCEDVFGNIIEKIMVDRNYKQCIQWLQQTLRDIVDGKFHVNNFIISNQIHFIKIQNYCSSCIGGPDWNTGSGNKPKPNDRIPYMYKKISKYEQCGFNKIKQKVQWIL